jgi:PAS domain S-box-containing protein
MQSSTFGGGARVAQAAVERPRPLRSDDRLLLGIVAAGALATALAASLPHALGLRLSPRARGEGAILIATLIAWTVLAMLAARRKAWRGTRLLALVIGLAAVFQATGWFWNSAGPGPPSDLRTSGTVLVLLLAYLGTCSLDFFDHIKHERRQLLSDVGLLATLAGAGAFLLLHDGGGRALPIWPGTLTAFTAAAAVLLAAGWGVLALWCPSKIHTALFACGVLLGGAAVTVDRASSANLSQSALALPRAALGLSVLAVVAVLIVEERLYPGQPRPPRALWWIRPTLLTVCIFGAGALLVFFTVDENLRMPAGESLAVGLIVLAALGGRMLASQFATTNLARELESALSNRESAIASLRSAADVVASSEARLRLLLDAAVDGLVELDAAGTIIRANGAFCAMVHLPMEQVIGQRWEEMARRSSGGASLLSLLETGHAVMVAEGGTSHLEARSSQVPTNPPGTLLMVRDVTASKAADQTIRTLFQFLQDRDEDRTRLLRRTNSAIEAERNRIARDLHDGPIQGVSAAALSLEAAKLMLESGDVTGSRDLLRQIVVELGDEAMNLRRVMSDLRPPLLEQRGLIPAVRELCARAERELGRPVTVVAGPTSEVPEDLETLAYRVVQEALSNIAKHAFASKVTVRIETDAGNLAVEIADDGYGFDPADARDFLASGRVGLASMRERAELAGGTFTVRSVRGSGTVVMATLPFEILGSVQPRF